VVALASVNPGLTPLNAGQLFLFPVKLLNLPPGGARLLSVSQGVLSEVISNDIFRPVVRNLDAEQLQLEGAGKAFHFDQLAMRELLFRPLQFTDVAVWPVATTIVNQTIALKGTEEGFLEIVDHEHGFSGGVPRVH